ncbi:hypothetical protein Taro_003145 [Colocasia esculenta]|uniref:Nuclear matrix constituent protein 1-like protein n=1 Tax=Colocasia esculenta TaxID=4460 RepID=A0A843TEI4_COLES|nr:hypothetical protein [Colocasia esculenta]
MFTPQPQRRGWSLTPRAADKNPSTPSYGKSTGGGLFGKGKGIVGSDTSLPPPPRGSLGENGNGTEDGGDLEVWKRFQEAGLLDQASLEKKDREALVQRVAKLEAELYEYQYNMGLLLIEKKEWTSKYEELRQGLAETDEILKREQTAHVIALSEVQKREDNLKKALGVEKQCVSDLEKALSELRAEYAEIKFTSDQKLADAHALMASTEEKALEVEAKLRSADAKLAEASRKGSEIERKLLDVAARESIAQRELASLNAEKELIKDDLDRQREDLRTWERNLQESQERLVESQSLLNQREKRSNELDKSLKEREKELQTAREMIEKGTQSLKEKENDINARLTALVVSEKEINTKKENLEEKERVLIALEDQLSAREKVEMQKLLDEHNAVLEHKKTEFEVEMEKRRSSLDEELKGKLAAVEKKADEINRKEEKIVKRELTLEKKMEKLKDEQKDLDVKSKALKKWEAAIKANEKDFEKRNKEFAEENQQLLISKDRLEAERAAVDAEKQRLATEMENLRITEAERAEYALLQSRLKEEIDECRLIKESLEKEREDLRKERESFEKEWDVLDEKRTHLMDDLKQFNDEKEKFEKWRHGEEERLNREQHATRDLIQKELDDLGLKKEHFERTMSQERSEVYEMLERERADAARALDLQKHELEISMQKKLEEMESQFHRKVAEFNEQREKELDHIKSLRESTVLEVQKMSLEQKRFEREKQEYADQRKKLEIDQLEIQNDIETLRTLSKNLKVQREDFIKEREQFLALVDQYKSCKNCGVAITELVFTGIEQLHEIEDPRDILLPSLAEGYLDEHLKVKKAEVSPVPESSPSGRMSWLRSCTKKIFNFSPVKRIEDSTDERSSQNRNMLVSENKDEAEPSFAVAADSDVERVQSGNDVPVSEASEKLNRAAEDLEPSLEVANVPVSVPTIESDSGIRDMEGEPVNPSVDGLGEEQGLSSLPEEHQAPEPKRKVGRTSKRGKAVIRRTRSVQEVVVDAKTFLKETSDRKTPANGDMKHSLDDIEESQGDSGRTDRKTNVGQKRRLGQTSGMGTGELEGEESEAHSESVSLGGRRKRRQTVVPAARAPGEKRYNLRRSTVANTAASSQALPDQTKGTKSTNRPPSPDDEVSKGVLEDEGTQKATAESTAEVIVSSEKLVSLSREEIYTEVQTETEENGELNLEFNDSSGNDVKDVGNEGNQTPVDDDEECDSDSSEDSSGSERHNASVGKKLWKFFTS